MSENSVPTISINRVLQKQFNTHMRQSYLDYALSVITSRALPDVRDGLKPVHRRILYTMHGNNLKHSSPYTKSARVVGDVMGKYHPHGDSSIYEAAVRMAQPFSLMHPLIDGQGNFGSMDDDPAAAMRYTEMRMSPITDYLFQDFNKEVVDFRPNYDGKESEPTILPAWFPNILVNGTSGIAVGMACSVPTHNLRDVINVTQYYIDHPDCDINDLLALMPAPDFPTGGLIHGLDGYINAMRTGRGSIRLRARYHTEPRKQGVSIVITELPYNVVKAKTVEKIGDLVKSKEIEGIVGLRDESDKDGVRVVIDLRKDVDPDIMFNQLITKKTNLEISVSYNMQLLLKKRPFLMNLQDILRYWLEARYEVIVRKYQFELKHYIARLHILTGLIKALNSIDELIKVIRAADDAESARLAVMSTFDLDDIQAKAIVEMRLSRLTGLEIKALEKEIAELEAEKLNCETILGDKNLQTAEIKETLNVIATKYGQNRCSEVRPDLSSVLMDELIEDKEVVVVYTRKGYIKTISADAINAQNRNTRGKAMMSSLDDDEIIGMQKASTRNYLLVFTDDGQVFAEKVYRLPESNTASRGRHIRNIIPEIEERRIMKVVAVSGFTDDEFVITVSANANIKRTPLSQYQGATRKGGVIGVKLDEGDSIKGVDTCRTGDHVMLISTDGQCIRMIADEDNLRPMGRSSAGPTGMRFDENASIVAMVVIPQGNDEGYALFSLGEKGVGKRTATEEFTPQHRGGRGVVCLNINHKTGRIVKAFLVKETQDVVMMSLKGVTNRLHVTDIRMTGRAAAGPYLMNLDTDDTVLDALTVERLAEEETVTETE